MSAVADLVPALAWRAPRAGKPAPGRARAGPPHRPADAIRWKKSGRPAPGRARTTELDAERRRLANAEQLAAAEQRGPATAARERRRAAGRAGRPRQAEQALSAPGADRSGHRAPGRTAGPRPSALLGRPGAASSSTTATRSSSTRAAWQQVEERLHLIHTLQRKYGDTIDDVLAYGERAAAELETITHAGERIAELEAEEDRPAGASWAGWARRCPRARRAAGERMARAIEAELADLQMARARFAVQIAWTPDPNGAMVDAAMLRRRPASARAVRLRRPRPGRGRVPGVGQPRRAAESRWPRSLRAARPRA